MPTTPCRKMETFGRVKMRVRGKRTKPALRPKLTVLGNVQAKQHRPHIQRMQTGPCRNIETFGRAKVRVRGETQRIRERREGGKAVERTSAPAETYPSRKLTGKKLRRHILKVKTAPCNKIKRCGRAKTRVREKL